MEHTPVRLTVYGCERDEAEWFEALAPRFGVDVTAMAQVVTDGGIDAAPATRCIAVGHTSELTGHDLSTLKDAGVEHISSRSIGLDHIDLAAAGRLGITVDNVVYAPDGVAEFTVMLILMALRNTSTVLASSARRDFRLDGLRGRDLCDLTVGVVGVGHIGSAVVTRLRGFGCRVIAHDASVTDVADAPLVPIDELLAGSDVVTLHVPLTAGTHHLIGADQIGAMKPGAVLVNTARGALVDTEALIAALESGRIGGAALDVIEGEEGLFYRNHTTGRVDHRFLHRLQRLPNAVVTPHMAFHTFRTLSETVEGTLTNCLDFERNRAHDQAQRRHPVRRMLGGA